MYMTEISTLNTSDKLVNITEAHSFHFVPRKPPNIHFLSTNVQKGQML